MIRRKDCSNRGKLMLLVGVLTALPLLILPFYPEDGCFWRSFLIPTLVSLTVGGALCLFGKGECSDSADRSANQRSSTKTVLFAWSWGILIGAMPFFLSGQLTAMQSLFESVSGWTTTGLSVMNVTETSHIFLFYRSLMQYCGGVGFILMMVMMVSDKRSMELFSAEGHPDMLMPNLKRTARTIFEMYLIFLAIGTAAYALCGMPVFDSLCHAMCSLSTGGFSTRLNSIGEYHSLAVEAVTIVLMLVGTTNFAVLLLLVQGKWKRVFRVSEVRFLFLILLIFVPMVTIFLCRDMHMGFGESLRHALFNTASALSTTGYATMGYETWPPFAVGVLILLMLIGGGMGSTAGG
ncbi:MAG: TrkH family potassium uptake protein, partial [Faecousia sp.]